MGVNDEAAGRKPYHPPRIVHLGNLRDLARGVNGSRPDTGQGVNTKVGQG